MLYTKCICHLSTFELLVNVHTYANKMWLPVQYPLLQYWTGTLTVIMDIVGTWILATVVSTK